MPVTRIAPVALLVLSVAATSFADGRLAARIEATPQSHPLAPALRLAAKSMNAVESVNDYEATFVKKELIGGELLSQQMKLKLRHSPLSVYLKYDQPHAGREVIYREGANDGNLLVHDAGIASLVGTISLDPKGAMAMSENHYPITMIGIRTMLDQVMEQWIAQTEMKDVTVNYYPNARIGDVQCKVVETSVTRKTERSPYQTTRLFIDAKTNLPLRVQQYGFAAAGQEKPLVEDYTYLNLKTNVDLSDMAFDTKNPKYAF